MAAKKKTAKKATTKAAPKKADRLAVKLLATLPALDDRRRKAYRAAFTDAQCEAWGAQTKSEAVLADAERAVGAVQGKLKNGGVTGYSAHRLAWLCHLMADLEDAIATQEAAEGTEARAERNAAVAVADRARKRLVAGLSSMAGGDAGLRKQIADRNESSTTPHVLESSLTGLVQLALVWRRTEFGEVLGDDAGVTDSFLSSVSAVVDSLREANEHTYGEGTGRDSAETNRIEGRVLRELGFLRRALAVAKDLGDSVPAFPPVKTLGTAENRNGNGKPGAETDEMVASPS
ncbi:MAG: hypothetical protein IT380_05425 [Myxococcales bacterium]|nr:hypothetical protein [Myxococcales bacterium]